MQCSGVECNGAVQWSSVVVEQRVPCGAVECRSCSGAVVEYRGAVDAWEHSVVEQFRGAVQCSAVQCSGVVEQLYCAVWCCSALCSAVGRFMQWCNEAVRAVVNRSGVVQCSGVVPWMIGGAMEQRSGASRAVVQQCRAFSGIV